MDWNVTVINYENSRPNHTKNDNYYINYDQDLKTKDNGVHNYNDNNTGEQYWRNHFQNFFSPDEQSEHWQPIKIHQTLKCGTWSQDTPNRRIKVYNNKFFHDSWFEDI